MNSSLRILFAGGNIRFGLAKIRMKRAILKSRLLTLATFFIFFSKGYSIGDNNQVGAREAALANASVAIISPFSVFHNQAAMARFKTSP